MNDNVMSDERVMRAFAAAGAERARANEMAASFPRPRIVDTLGGFVVDLDPPGPEERRFVQVILSADGSATASTYDTLEAGTREVDKAVVREERCGGWDDVAAFLAAEGLAVEATISGEPAALRLVRDALAFSEVNADGSVGHLRGYVRFEPGKVTCHHRGDDPLDQVTYASTDWHEVEAYLARRGVGLRAVAPEPAPSHTP